LNASEAEASDVNLRAESAITLGTGLFDSLKTAIDLTIPALPCNFNGYHDINNSLETVPRS
jgi:hypothetical protein